MIDNLKVAEVLEKAADLYESEQVEWCAGSWYQPAYEEMGVPLMACAASALALAAGFNVQEGRFSGDEIDAMVDLKRAHLRAVDADTARLYIGARLSLEERIGQVLWVWNDAKELDGGSYHYSRSKAEVIELFKETAKDLRNQEAA